MITQQKHNAQLYIFDILRIYLLKNQSQNKSVWTINNGLKWGIGGN